MKEMTYIIRCWLIAVGCCLLAACTETVSDARQEAAQPQIYPDYVGVTIPVNIAPLNFSFNRGNPADMSLHIRGPHSATLLRHDNSPLTAYETKADQTLGFCVYPYWHPSGRYVAYSTNTTRQLFHTAAKNRIEVSDEASDLQIFGIHNVEESLARLGSTRG